MTRATWGLAGVAVIAATIGFGCRPEKGRPFSYAGTIENEIDIGPEVTHTYLEQQFGEPFELPGGRIRGTFGFNVPKAAVGGVPRMLDWTFSWYDATNSIQLAPPYTITAPLKMHPAGGGYAISYKFSDKSFPGYSMAQNDYLRLSITPHLGGLSVGDTFKINYVYTPQF